MRSARRACFCRFPDPILVARCSGHPLWRTWQAGGRSFRTLSTKHPPMQEQVYQKQSAACGFVQEWGRRKEHRKRRKGGSSQSRIMGSQPMDSR